MLEIQPHTEEIKSHEKPEQIGQFLYQNLSEEIKEDKPSYPSVSP